jgi:hypothetical protein
MGRVDSSMVNAVLYSIHYLLCSIIRDLTSQYINMYCFHTAFQTEHTKSGAAGGRTTRSSQQNKYRSERSAKTTERGAE